MAALDIVGIAVTAALIINFALYLRSGDLATHFRLLRSLNGKWISMAVVGSLAVLVTVAAVGLALTSTAPSPFGWSWLNLFHTATGEPEQGRNILAGGLSVPGLVWVFWALLALNVPRLALNEEYAFRKGHKTGKAIVWNSIKFGLAHCLVGVPIGWGLALSVTGLWLAFIYVRGGIKRSAASHAVYNWTLLVLFAVFTLWPVQPT